MDKTKVEIYNEPKPIIKINLEGIDINSTDFIIKLYDEYTLTIAEISAIINKKYFQTNNLLKTLDLKTNKKSGRRNSSYGLKFSEERLKHMSESQKGNIPVGYIRTNEIKNKISNTLKKKYLAKEISVNKEALSKAWEDGKYKNAKMGRGIQGYFFSLKNNKDFYFRSLLELKFMIILENESKVFNYQFEKICIKMEEGHRYTPDVLINDKFLIELKPRCCYKYDNNERLKAEQECAIKYCKQNNLEFRYIYDDELDFNSSQYRKYLKNNPNIIRQYNIRFKKKL